MILILLGAPGTGKGTQAKLLAAQRGWLHLSTGDMLRENVTHGTALGNEAKQYMDAGRLVPDNLIIAMLLARIESPDVDAGLIIEGFPRTLPQAVALDEALLRAAKAVDAAVNISVPDEELVRRLSSRWMCRNCGRITNSKLEKCPTCGSDELYQRDDDKPETVRTRLETMKPPAEILEHYRKAGKLRDVNGMQPIERVTKDLLQALEGVRA
jgi:adenylate kinase